MKVFCLLCLFRSLLYVTTFVKQIIVPGKMDGWVEKCPSGVLPKTGHTL